MFKKLAIAILALVWLAGCTTVEPGHVGIKINMWGAQRGVSDLPIVTGRVAYNPFTTRIFEYPTFVQTAIWTADKEEGSPANEEVCFNSVEGLVICGDISLSVQLADNQVPWFYVKFRSDDLSLWTHGYLRNVARDAMNEVGSKYSAEDLYGEKKEQFLQEVRDRINSHIKQYAHLEQYGFIGAPRLPKNVVEALNMKIKATQDAMTAENQLRQTEAEARKTVAAAQGQAQAQVEIATAQAKANELLSNSITQKLLEWRRLEVMQQKWNGDVPRFVTGGASGSNPLLMLNITPDVNKEKE